MIRDPRAKVCGPVPPPQVDAASGIAPSTSRSGATRERSGCRSGREAVIRGSPWDAERSRRIARFDPPTAPCDAASVAGTDAHIHRPPPSRRELVRTWALAVGGLAAARLVSLAEPTGILAANLAGVAAFLLVALPDAPL